MAALYGSTSLLDLILRRKLRPSFGVVHMLYDALGVGEWVEILLYCVVIGEGILEPVLHNIDFSPAIYGYDCA